jgi:rRNA maturation RNase YbeY
MIRPSKCLIVNRQRRHAINAARVRQFVLQLNIQLGEIACPFSVVFVTDEAMRSYNRKYRGMDKPTDVLSFTGDGDYLGDILISAETAYNQARKSPTLTFETNVRRLLLHGLLHLLGYDHETDSGQMRALERRLRRRLQC